MIKNTVLALLAVASLSAIAVPAASARDANGGIFGSGDNSDQDWVAGSVLSRLHAQGINASSVEEWNGLVRAYVTLEDGRRVMQFFTPGSLEQVAL